MTNIAIVRPGALGDIFCLLPLIPLIKKEYSSVSIYVHESNFKILSQFVTDAGPQLKIKFSPTSQLIPQNYSKVIHISGYPSHEGYPNVELKRHIIKTYALELGCGVIDAIPSLSLASYPPPHKLRDKNKIITIQTQTGWSRYKELGFLESSKLVHEIKKVRPNCHIVQIGGPEHNILPNIDEHFIGESFKENISAQSWADLHIGPDSVFGHTSNIIWSHKNRKTKSIIYFGSTSPIGFAYSDNISVYMGLDCQPCYRENPEISSQNTTPCPFTHKCLKNNFTLNEILDKVLENI